ncbi:hypothetical protein H920_11296 [Fukomys damarensis]|uniref:Uncharacterized protein n=1 Tax=Fukomys damarensis TaxID=885580 RepID=A0A091DWW9_FUKDA|nr:hypothetical protein H920_11296 [Fukomys damarensis]
MARLMQPSGFLVSYVTSAKDTLVVFHACMTPCVSAPQNIKVRISEEPLPAAQHPSIPYNPGPEAVNSFLQPAAHRATPLLQGPTGLLPSEARLSAALLKVPGAQFQARVPLSVKRPLSCCLRSTYSQTLSSQPAACAPPSATPCWSSGLQAAWLGFEHQSKHLISRGFLDPEHTLYLLLLTGAPCHLLCFEMKTDPTFTGF